MADWKSNDDMDLLKYRMAYNNVRELIIFYDDNGKIIDINSAALDKLNFVKSNILNKSISNIYKDTHTMTLGEVKETVAYKQNGSFIYVELTVNRIRNFQGYIWIAVASDITSQKEIMKESFALKNELDEANRVKEEFIVNITHELRTPINGILGWSRLTLDTDLTIEQKRNIKIIVDSAANLLSIVNEILEFSKIVSNKVLIKEKPFNIREVVEMIILFNNYLLTKNNVTINFNIAQTIPKIIIGDSLKVFQVLNNLVSSALNYTYDGSLDLNIKICDIENNALKLLLEIVHQEPNFNQQMNLFGEEDVLIYEKFWGTELGIDICKNLINAMSGNVELIRKNKIDSIFRFTLSFKLLESDLKKIKKLNKSIMFSNKSQIENYFSQKYYTNPEIKDNNQEIIRLIDKLHECILLKDQEKSEMIAKNIKNRLMDNGLMSKKIFKIQLEIRKENFLNAALELEELNILLRKEDEY